MSNRITDLADIVGRLQGNTAVGDQVHQSRVLPVPDERLPVILAFAMEESGDPVSASSHPQFRDRVTFSIQSVVVEAAGWDAEAMVLTEQVKTLLYSDPEWLAKWKEVPGYSVRQFVDDKAARTIAGEVLTITAERARPTEFTPQGTADLSGVDTTVDLQTGADGDAVDITQTVE